jgi:DNA-binding NtrC family response regulator
MSKTILVVDDDQSVNAIFDYVLKQAGYSTLCALSGKDALDIITSDKKVDLMFLDLKLPDISGLELFKKIQEVRPNLLVILITGYLINDTLKEAFELGAYGVIYKPFDVDEVLGIVEKIFKPSSLNK